MASVRWGVLGTAKIAIDRVIPAMKSGQFCRVDAIASREPYRAESAAHRMGIPKAYGSYAALLGDLEIDAVYIPLPNHLHVPWSIRALDAGKHVLCEKPIALNASEAKELLRASHDHPDLKVMEGFMYRHHPQWKRARQLCEKGTIGDLRLIQSIFSYFNMNPDDIRNKAQIGGGALLDVGCYCVSLSRYLFGSEPARVFGVMDVDATFETDRTTSGVLDFGQAVATFTCSTQLARYQRVSIFGTEGSLEIEVPFTPPPDQSTRIFHQSDGTSEEILIGPCNQYRIQADVFSRAIIDGGELPTTLHDAVANMDVMDRMVRSATRGMWSQ
jgi:predicted dehydrogenase